MVVVSSQGLQLRPSIRSNTESNSRARSADRAPAADGFARTTSRLPAGRRSRRSRTTCRSRRRTLLRTTAGPTARPTMKPTREGSSLPRANMYTTRRRRPARRPRRSASAKSSRRRILDLAGSTTAPIREVRSRLRSGALPAASGAAGQPASRVRPLRRRAATIARPARVRMRSRNPWVLARRRLFGWNVRLLTAAPTT